MNIEERDKSVEVLTEVKKALESYPDSSTEAWPLFTGTPTSMVEKLLEWGVGQSVPADALLVVVAAIAFAHGKKVSQTDATESKAAASN